MNSKKIISSVSLTTAILATGILSQEAHADDLTPNTNATAPATTETVAPTASKQAESKPVTQADVTSAETTYNQATAEVATAQADVNAKTQAQTSAQTAVNTATPAVTDAKRDAAEATPEGIAKAEKAITTAESDVTAKENAVESAKTEQTKADKDVEAKADFDKVSEAYAKVLEAERQKAIAESYAKIVADGHTPVPVVDANGTVVGYQALETQNQTVKAQASINQTHFTNQAKATAKGAAQSGKTLPETGEVSSALHILGSFLVGLGLAATDRRKRRG